METVKKNFEKSIDDLILLLVYLIKYIRRREGMSLLQSSSLVRQLANRLETSNVAERISALQELQTLAKSIPHVVGELGM